MMSPTLFEIVIPTLNRRELALQRLREFEVLDCDSCSLLLSDNQSDDGTYESALALRSSVIRIRQTVGDSLFFNNILTSLRSCSADWAILCSDEDTVDVRLLGDLADIARQGDADVILGSVVQQQLPFKGKGRSFSDGVPLFSEMLGHNYLSGICFRVSSLMAVLDSLADTVNSSGNFFLENYPHQAIIWLAYVKGALRSTSSLLIIRGPSARSSLPVRKTASGNRSIYLSVDGRWRNWVGGREWIASMASSLQGDEQCKRHAKLSAYHDHQVLSLLRRGVQYDYPAATDCFDRAIVNYAKRISGYSSPAEGVGQ